MLDSGRHRAVKKHSLTGTEMSLLSPLKDVIHHQAQGRMGSVGGKHSRNQKVCDSVTGNTFISSALTTSFANVPGRAGLRHCRAQLPCKSLWVKCIWLGMLSHAMAKPATSENTNVYRYKQLDVYMERPRMSTYFMFIKCVSKART